MIKKPLFCCYSLNLRNFLTDNGVRYEICALNPNSKTMFWVYMRNETLDVLLQRWTDEKPVVVNEAE